jgi:hypothetical protein
MARISGRTWKLVGAAALALVVAVGAYVALRGPGTPQTGSAASAASIPLLAPTAGETRWQDLTPAQQRALEPLKKGWEDLGPVRKQKWLEIAGRFNSMKPAEQQRVHDRMRAWVDLTPEERKAVRENYARAQKIMGGKKAAQWEQYLLLPEEEKRKLADAAASRKPQAAKPPTPKQNLVKTPQPIKQHPSVLPTVPPPPVVAVPPTPTQPPVAPVAPAPASPPQPEIVYPLEGAVTPAAMVPPAPPAPPPPAPANAGK